MWVAVKLTFFCLVLRTACGHSGPDYQYFISPLRELSEETLKEDALANGAANYPEGPVDGPFGSKFPRYPPNMISENLGEVNAREDIPSKVGRNARFFHPYDVALASRAIERRVHEALRDFSDRFDLRFPKGHLAFYGPRQRPPPVDSFGHPPPPHLPLPFHPPPFPFHKPFPPPGFMPDSPNIPYLPSPPGNPPRRPFPPPPPGFLPFPPSNPPPFSPPPLFPFPPQKPEIPPPLHPPYPDPDASSNEKPTVMPPTNATDVWEIILPWWFPAHMRPPTTIAPPQIPTSESDVDVAVNTEIPEEAETSTPASPSGSEETTIREIENEVEFVMGGEIGESNPDALPFVVPTTVVPTTPQKQADTDTLSVTTTEIPLIPLIGEIQADTGVTTTEAATTTEEELLLEEGSEISTEFFYGNDTTGTLTVRNETNSDGDKIESTSTSSPFDGLIEEIKTIVSTANTIIDEKTTAEVSTTDSTVSTTDSIVSTTDSTVPTTDTIVSGSNIVQDYLKSNGVFDSNEVNN